MPSNSSFTARSVSLLASDVNDLRKHGYYIGKKIGKGSYATVAIALYEEQQQKIKLACKIVDKSKAAPDFLKKFLPRELEIITKLQHPHIIQTHSIVQRGPKIFIFMRHAENGDLLNYINTKGTMPEHHARIWFYQMVEGLEYLHNLEIAHRDLKCENILITRNNNVKIADFGFARFAVNVNGTPILSRTHCGSAAYAAPEIVIGNAYDPKKSDIWSLGVIVFIMLNKAMPFDDTDLRKLVHDQKHRNYNFRKSVENKLSCKCKALISLILDPDVRTRWTLERIKMSHWRTSTVSISEGVPK